MSSRGEGHGHGHATFVVSGVLCTSCSALERVGPQHHPRPLSPELSFQGWSQAFLIGQNVKSVCVPGCGHTWLCVCMHVCEHTLLCVCMHISEHTHGCVSAHM